MRRILGPFLSCLLICGCGGKGGDSTAESTRTWNGEVQVYGTLRGMFHAGQTGAQVTLDTVLPNPDLYAVGALADLSGEITVIAGSAYLSYPEGADSTRTEMLSASGAGAALLVTAEVPRWRTVTAREPIRFEALDEAIGKLAVSAGMSPDARFPFLMEGDFENLQWHVIDGKRLAAGETSHQDHLQAAVQVARQRASARLVGFYSQNDQGVFTHMGSRTHLHCVLEGPLAAGHVDHVDIPAGTKVKFPEGGNSSAGAHRSP
jgi:alpha-acetolactate decarboxylase